MTISTNENQFKASDISLTTFLLVDQVDKRKQTNIDSAIPKPSNYEITTLQETIKTYKLCFLELDSDVTNIFRI